ncbi:MAG: GTP cyclohydrolase I [Phocaeicola sp.]
MEIKPTNTEDIEHSIKEIFKHIGEDPEREGLKGTPERIIRMWKEVFRGYDPKQKPKITVFNNQGIDCGFPVLDSGNFYSMCEHHMMPFFGRYWFGYIPNPNGKILGISKVARVVDYCAAKMQVQERLGKDIVQMIFEALQDQENPPIAVGIILEGEHLCKSMRGVKKQGKMRSAYFIGGDFNCEPLRKELHNFKKQ